MIDLSEDDFERLVSEEFDALPDDMLEGLDNVAIMVENRHESEELFGIYEGISLPHRGQYGFGELPDRIRIFRETHLKAAGDLEQLREEVRRTLVHEIAHFYGFDDEQLHELGWG